VVLVAAATTITVLLAGGGKQDNRATLLSQDTPEATARSFARAATAHDAAAIRALVCAEQQDDAARFINYTDYPARAADGLSGVRMTVEFGGVVPAKFGKTTIALSFSYSGVPANLRDEDSLVNRTEEFTMTESGGRWVLCDDLV
jgi:hypothetical protein